MISTSFLQAQEILKGKVEVDSIIAGTVHIINVTQQTGTLNSSSGSFEIKVNLNDTLWFTSVQYRKEEVIITPAILAEGFLLFKLQEEVNELEEVHLSNINLSGNMTWDVGNIEILNKYALGVPLNKKKLPTKPERELAAQGQFQIGATTSVPLDLVLNSITGRLGRLKLMKAHGDLDLLTEKARNSFPMTFFIDKLGIPEGYIKEFLYYSAEGGKLQQFLNAEDRLKLLEYFKETAITFKDRWELNK